MLNVLVLPCYARVGARLLSACSFLLAMTACSLTSQQRVLYESAGIQIGVVTDRSTDEHASPPTRNRHPAEVTPRDLRTLLSSLEVSGWSGAMIGLLLHPEPKPVFTDAELVLLAEPLSSAFHHATPYERVFFSLQNPNAPYATDRTAGSLFFRDDYLHVILTDHYAFLKADPGGGEKRDPRDTKGMKLWAVGPARAATVPDEKEPHWTAFETVHVSIKPEDILAGKEAPPAAPKPSSSKTAVSTAPQPVGKSASKTPDGADDLHSQIRELNSANSNLRSQVNEQSEMIKKLTNELEELRNEVKRANPKSDRLPPRSKTTP